MHPALFYLPGERLSQPELCAARLDGHVVEVGEGYMPADTVESPGARARALGSLVSEGLAVCGPSAAWVHGAGDGPPARHHLQRAVPRRIRPRVPPRVVFHDTELIPTDVADMGGILVTTPVRTLVDLVCAFRRDPSARRWADRLAAACPDALAPAEEEIRGLGRVPGKRDALTLLASFSALRRT